MRAGVLRAHPCCCFRLLDFRWILGLFHLFGVVGDVPDGGLGRGQRAGQKSSGTKSAKASGSKAGLQQPIQAGFHRRDTRLPLFGDDRLRCFLAGFPLVLVGVGPLRLGGALDLLDASGETPVELRRRVTSPGGSTERAIAVFEEADLKNIFTVATDAAVARQREMGKA